MQGRNWLKGRRGHAPTPLILTRGGPTPPPKPGVLKKSINDQLLLFKSENSYVLGYSVSMHQLYTLKSTF